MAIIVSIIIPILTALILLVFFHKKVTIGEYCLVLFPAILVGILMNFFMISYNTTKTEYMGDYGVAVKHYDAWDEYIHKTCTERYACGKDEDGNTEYCTRDYDCSYVDYHSEYWVLLSNLGAEITISKKTFDKLVAEWDTPMEFIDMHRQYHSIDGDCQKYRWDLTFINSPNLTFTHRYENKVQASYSIFKFEQIDKKQAAEYGLYDYPPLTNKEWRRQDLIIGGNVSDEDKQYFECVSAHWGKMFQFRSYLLIYYDKSSDIAMKQRDYWGGGNKNEFVICVGMDSLSNKIDWVQTFSWSDDRTLSIDTEEYLIEKDTLDVKNLALRLYDKVPIYWKRKQFADFAYLQPEITQNQLSWIIIMLIIIEIGIGVFVVKNE